VFVFRGDHEALWSDLSQLWMKSRNAARFLASNRPNADGVTLRVIVPRRRCPSVRRKALEE